MNSDFERLTPRNIVTELDRDIVGQDKGKRAVAVAIRNRMRRQRLDPELGADVNPKNIILIGPTGVGKTEIARRLSRLLNAPFVKVEATKFTEVGYMGRDVESMVRDLVHNGISRVRAEESEKVEEEARRRAEETLLDALLPSSRPLPPFDIDSIVARFGEGIDSDEIVDGIVDGSAGTPDGGSDNDAEDGDEDNSEARERLRRLLRRGKLDDQEIEITLRESASPAMDVVAMGPGAEEMEIQFRNVLKGIMPERMASKRMTVAEARPLLHKEHIENLLDMDKIVQRGIERVEQSGIIFLDEIDKVAMPHDRRGGSGPDVSREGVQRDLLPVVEGTTVMTKYGPVSTNHILFIAAGAFHMSKPSDLIPELQGRFPIRVELEDLGVGQLRRILVEPRSALVKQYKALLKADGVELDFTDKALDTIAEMAHQVNQEAENLGARRLQTVMEKLLEDVLFDAPDGIEEERKIIDEDFVRGKLSSLVGNRDLSRFIL